MRNSYLLFQLAKPQSYFYPFFVFILLSYWLCGTHTLHAQQLVINEVSQGSNGDEYIELLVVGEDATNNPDCVPCLDIRGWVIDDNNGDFFSNTGGSQYVSTGALRFANDDNWACVPNGSLIVIYNEENPNFSIMADDPTDNNKDYVYILQGSSSLLEGNKDMPNSTNPNYWIGLWLDPPAWNVVYAGQMISFPIMNNGGDVIQVRDNNFNLVHSITWGTIIGGDITFTGSANNLVFEMENLSNNDPFNQTNWIANNVPTGETPGQPNSTANTEWIASMIGSCVCVEELELTPIETGSRNYIASEAIYSNDTIISGENVIYDAGDIIELINGFSVDANANLSILTEGCEID